MTAEELKRLEICNSCSETIKLGKEKICSKCGCPVLSKIRVQEEQCKLNK